MQMMRCRWRGWKLEKGGGGGGHGLMGLDAVTRVRDKHIRVPDQPDQDLVGSSWTRTSCETMGLAVLD